MTQITHPRAAETPAGGTLRDWCVVLLLTGAMMFSLMDRIGIAVLIEPIKHSLKMDDASFGLLNGLAFGLFYSFMGLPFGWLADRWSRKGTITLGIGIWSVATASCGLAASFWQLLFARLFVGAGEAGLAPAAYGIIHDRVGHRNLATAISLLQIGSALGAGSALLVASYAYGILSRGAIGSWPLIGTLEPWQQTFVFLALPGVFFVLAIPLIRDRRGTRPSRAKGSGGLSLVSALRLKGKLYLRLFAGMSAILVVNNSLLAWTPAILGREFGWSPSETGVTYGTIVLICAPAGLLFGGWLCDFLARRQNPYAHSIIPLAAAIGGGLAAIWLPLATNPVVFLSVTALLQFCVALPIGVVPAYVQILTPAPARSRVSAFYVLMVNLFGLGLASVLIGGISAHFPNQPSALRLTVGYCSIVSFLAAILFLISLQKVAKSTDA